MSAIFFKIISKKREREFSLSGNFLLYYDWKIDLSYDYSYFFSLYSIFFKRKVVSTSLFNLYSISIHRFVLISKNTFANEY